jgi:hypothetical protein
VQPAKGVIMPENNFQQATTVVCKSSSQYDEMVNMFNTSETTNNSGEREGEKQDDVTDFSLLKESVNCVIDQLSTQNDTEQLTQLCQIKHLYDSQITYMQKDLHDKDMVIVGMEDHLYRALTRMLQFCVKYEKRIFS